MDSQSQQGPNISNLINKLADCGETGWEQYIKIMAVTWNMGGSNPDLGIIDKVFQKETVVHDMYVFGSQEAVRSIS